MSNELIIEDIPCTVEKWYRGTISHEEILYPFFIIYREETDTEEEESAEVRWMYKKVPLEVRKMEADIIHSFKYKYI